MIDHAADTYGQRTGAMLIILNPGSVLLEVMAMLPHVGKLLREKSEAGVIMRAWHLQSYMFTPAFLTNAKSCKAVMNTYKHNKRARAFWCIERSKNPS